LNSAGAVPQRETRINNDEQRTTASLGVMARRLELLLLASHGERGMVGPANVRSADADRAVTSRQLLRAQTTVAGTTLLSGVRGPVDDEGVPVGAFTLEFEKGTTLVRASFDLTVGRDLEAQLAVEGDEVAPLRLVGTASPRRAPW
jgi:hypothetical protein